MINWLSFSKRFFFIFQTGFSLIFLERQRKPETRFRLFFERSGGAFIKLGQILSLRHDIIPHRYANELTNLLSKVNIVSYDQIREVFVDELGELPEIIFLEFDTIPIASASISQVYRARLPNGDRVVVKIQRPGIMEVFENDFVLSRLLSWIVGFFSIFNSFQIKDVVEEFIIWSRRELDFRTELLNSQILAKRSETHPQTIIPRFFSEWSTERVLVVEDMSEVFSVEKVIKSLDSDPHYRKLLATQYNIDVEKLAYYFFFDIMRQYFIDGFFHADPHPANIFFAPGNFLGYFDFGIVGRAGKPRLDLLQIVYGIANRDLVFSSRYFLKFAKTAVADEVDLFKHQDPDTYKRFEKVVDKLEEIVLDNLRSDLEKILSPWYQERDRLNYEHLTSSVVFSRMLLKTRDYQIYLPREIVSFFRTLVIADMVAVKLLPSFDIIKALKDFFKIYPVETVAVSLTKDETTVANKKLDYHWSFEQLLELKARDKERLGLAKEKLVDLISGYAEKYEEVRQLLKA